MRRAAWYSKAQAASSETIPLVRHYLWHHGYFSTSQAEADVVKSCAWFLRA
jgi:hypothetical protein